MTKNSERNRFLRLAAAVRHQCDLIRRVVAEAREALDDFAESEPPPRELRGIGGILHDFYTGIEHVFDKIAPELNGGVPQGQSWHRELLENMTLDLPGVRPPLLRVETGRALDEYLRFRHLFRHLYGFDLEWPKMRALLETLPSAWNEAETDFMRFVEFLETAASSDS